MPQPIQFSADAGRVATALRTLLAALEAHPIRKSRLSVAWDGFRSAFGEGPSPEGVSVDSNNRPDLFGLQALIRASTGASGEARDALQDVADAFHGGGAVGCAWVLRDATGGPEPTPDELREHERQARDADEAPVRRAKAAIRSALLHLPSAPAGSQPGERSQIPAVLPLPADPVFAEAAARRRRDYDARITADREELRRLCQPLDDAADYRASTQEEFIAGWASALVTATGALDRAELGDLRDDEPGKWMPWRLACAALRSAVRGQAEAEQAVREILVNEEHRNGVGPALGEIAKTAARRLRERQEAALRRDYQDLAPAAESHDPPPTKAGYDPSEREPRTFAELATCLAEWEYVTRPSSRPRRIPVTAHDPDTLYLQSYCKATFGGWDIDALAKLRDQYAVQTGVTMDQYSPTPLCEIAAHFRALGRQTPAAEPPAAAQPDGASFRLLRVFTNGLSDERIEKAARLLADDSLTANEKLTRIDALLPFPAKASAEQLGDMLGVSKQAVLKTPWWVQNRKGEKEDEVGRRRAGHQKRAEGYEPPLADDAD
jgi:hypothetical protein